MIKKNNAQEKAIQTISGQLILVACPGAGKTTTLLRRINYMITKRNINPLNILMITFTKAAADEMNKRYARMFGKNPGVTFCTIHSFCLAITKKFSLKKLSVLSELEKYTFFRDKIRYNASIADKDAFISDIILDISILKNNMLSVSEYSPNCTVNKDLFQGLYTDYEDYKEKKGKMDYDDILLIARDILLNNNIALQWLRERYQYIQVDEYQDTNYLQRDIIYQIAGKTGNLAVVGDDDQSIYAFRGARPEIMLNFTKDFPNAALINMSTNYRSLKNIIHDADLLIKQNQVRFAKDFIGFREADGCVKYINYKDNTSQVDTIVKKIQEMIEKGENPNDIAILYRINKESMPFAEKFIAKKMQFQCNEKLMSKYDHWMFQDILAYHEVATGNDVDGVFFRKILNHPNRFFFGKTFSDVKPDINLLITAIIRQKKKEQWQINKAIDKAYDLFRNLNILKEAAPEDFLTCLWKDVGYKDFIREYAKSRNMEPKELKEIWDDYKKEAKNYKTWEEWKKAIEIYRIKLAEANQSKGGITLSTMHRSKGLEWKNVFIIDCVEGIYPFEKATKPEQIEEERRLFYVAMTRAKDNLYLTSYDKKNGKNQTVSRFLSNYVKNK